MTAIGVAPALAAPYQQSLSITAQPDARSPVYGDPGARTFNPHWTVRQWALADHQGPNTENGNQPDRAEAGAGAR